MYYLTSNRLDNFIIEQFIEYFYDKISKNISKLNNSKIEEKDIVITDSDIDNHENLEFITDQYIEIDPSKYKIVYVFDSETKKKYKKIGFKNTQIKICSYYNFYKTKPNKFTPITKLKIVSNKHIHNDLFKFVPYESIPDISGSIIAFDENILSSPIAKAFDIVLFNIDNYDLILEEIIRFDKTLIDDNLELDNFPLISKLFENSKFVLFFEKRYNVDFSRYYIKNSTDAKKYTLKKLQNYDYESIIYDSKHFKLYLDNLHQLKEFKCEKQLSIIDMDFVNRVYISFNTFIKNRSQIINNELNNIYVKIDTESELDNILYDTSLIRELKINESLGSHATKYIKLGILDIEKVDIDINLEQYNFDHDFIYFSSDNNEKFQNVINLYNEKYDNNIQTIKCLTKDTILTLVNSNVKYLIYDSQLSPEIKRVYSKFKKNNVTIFCISDNNDERCDYNLNINMYYNQKIEWRRGWDIEKIEKIGFDTYDEKIATRLSNEGFTYKKILDYKNAVDYDLFLITNDITENMLMHLMINKIPILAPNNPKFNKISETQTNFLLYDTKSSLFNHLIKFRDNYDNLFLENACKYAKNTYFNVDAPSYFNRFLETSIFTNIIINFNKDETKAKKIFDSFSYKNKHFSFNNNFEDKNYIRITLNEDFYYSPCLLNEIILNKASSIRAKCFRYYSDYKIQNTIPFDIQIENSNFSNMLIMNSNKYLPIVKSNLLKYLELETLHEENKRDGVVLCVTILDKFDSDIIQRVKNNFLNQSYENKKMMILINSEEHTLKYYSTLFEDIVDVHIFKTERNKNIMQTIKYLVQTIDCDYVCNFDYFAIYYENYITNRMNIIGDKLYLIVLCGLVNCQGKYYIRNSEYEINKRLQILSSGNMFAKDYIVNRNNNLCNKARKFFKYILEVVKFDFEVLDTNDPNDFLLGSKI